MRELRERAIMFRFLPLVLKNSWRNRRRTFLTIASVTVSMCLLGVLISVYHALYLSDPTPEQALRMVTRNKISLTQPLPESYRNQIRQIPGVREVLISDWFGGTYKDPKDFFSRFAVDAGTVFKVYRDLRIPDDQRLAFEHDRTGCVIGRAIADKFHLHIGDHMTLMGDIYPGNYEFTIRGIFDAGRNTELMYFSREYLEQSLPEARRGAAGVFTMLIDSPNSADRIAQTIDGEYSNSTEQTKTESEQAYLLGFASFLGNVKMFLIAISAAVMFTILLVSGNTMAMTVRERVREIGVMKTLGFTNGNILGMILGEAFAISLAGGTLGYILSAGLTAGVAHSPAGEFLPPAPPFDPAVGTVCIVTACAIGVISSLIPAVGGARTSIVEALRSED
jgi:putative ABC transport system permease protein